MKNSGLAAILSFFFPGLGQLYNGQFGKGILFFVINGINFFLAFVLIGFVTAGITALFASYDAYRSAEKINKAQQQMQQPTQPVQNQA